MLLYGLLIAICKFYKQDNEFAEDITLEALYVRHDRASAEERKKFSTLMKFPWRARSRANRRIDSQADSSGANTPDPMSPAPKTPSVSGDHEVSIYAPSILNNITSTMLTIWLGLAIYINEFIGTYFTLLKNCYWIFEFC